VLAALAAIALLALAISVLVGFGRRLAHERSTLLEEAGFLERALLPEVPEQVGPLPVSVAYRPADGPGAGGDFYDVFQLDDRRVAAIVGDVSGHGRAALERATLMHYTLRAYLETGLSPRSVLELADEVRADGPEGQFATALIAIYDAGRATLSYARAGHPPPIVLGPVAHEPVTGCSSPPLGLGVPMALRQSTVALPAGSTACLYTDGVVEARSGGLLLGRQRLADLVEECGSGATATELFDLVTTEAGRMPDDMTACVMRPIEGSVPATLRTEELELRDQAIAPVERFLLACGVGGAQAQLVTRAAQETVRRAGAAVVRISWARAGMRTEVLPADARPQPSLRRPTGRPLACRWASAGRAG
jgi:serine phosphatase RsbU (regulator of sigma subunit)